MHKTPKLRFNKFTEFWKFTNLEDAYIKGRIGWKNLTRDEYTKEGPYFISGKDINDGKIMWDTCEHITIERYEESPEIKLQNNDIILTQRGTLGNSAFIENLTKKATINANMILLRANKEIYPLYLYYIIKSDYFKKFIHKITSVGCISSLFQKDLKKFEFPYPSYEEQKEISYFLSEIDIKIDLMERKHKLLIKFKLYLLNKIFKSSFSDEWMIRKLSDIAVIGKGFTPSTRNPDFWDGEYSWLSIADMPENNESKYITNSKKTITQEGTKNRNIIKKGTLIMSFKLSVGKLGILKKDMYTNEAICNFTWKKEDISTEYMYYYLSSINIMKYGAQAVKGVTLNNDSLNSIPIKLPPVKVQEKIALFLSYIDRKIELSNKQIDLMKNYKSGLLQKMFI